MGEPGYAVILAARLGDLAFGFTEGLRAEIGRLERVLAAERRRHSMEVAALRAEGQRRARALEHRLAAETARATELESRVTFAEHRAAVAVTERVALERHLSSADLVRVPQGAPAPA